MGPTTMYVVGGVAVLAVAGAAVYVAVRWRQFHAKDEGYYHFRCPGCKRRLRFQARQVGRKGRCSHCAKDITFPAVSQSID